MMELIRQWVLGVTCAAMLASVVQTFLPKDGIGKAGRIAAGLLVMLAAVRPLTGLEGIDPALSLDGLRDERTAYEQALQNSADELLEAVIVRQCEAYISDKAKELGIDCRVSVACTPSEGGVPCPSGARIDGTLSGEQRQKLSALLESELGIPPGSQSFTEEVEGWTPEG